MHVQQRKNGLGPYRVQREAANPTDTLVNGIGNPVKPVGLIASCFRPSDDACIFSFLVPSNLFAVVVTVIATMANSSSRLKMANDTTTAKRSSRRSPTALVSAAAEPSGL